MKLVFVYWAMEDQGSGLVIQGYTEAARAMGHEVCVYGRWIPGKVNPTIPLNYSLDLGSADAAVFLFEWTTKLKPGDELDLSRLVARVPRHRRVIIDGDGKYNDLLQVADDYNHPDAESARQWVRVCDSLTDKICQPTLHPLRPNVRPFLFYAYNPSWERPFAARRPDPRGFDMLYVGHSKFRWGPMMRVLRAIEPNRQAFGRLGVLGYGWETPPWWAAKMQTEQTYRTDADYLKRLGVEFLPPVPFGQVIDWMSRATFNPVLMRPVFGQLRMVTPRIFETPAAATIPLLVLDPDHVREIYGEAALPLVLSEEDAAEQALELVRRPDRYREMVLAVRRHMRTHHSHEVRLRRLIEIIQE